MIFRITRPLVVRSFTQENLVGQAIGKMFSDADSRGFINAVIIKWNAIGFFDIQRRRNSPFAGHIISSEEILSDLFVIRMHDLL